MENKKRSKTLMFTISLSSVIKTIPLLYNKYRFLTISIILVTLLDNYWTNTGQLFLFSCITYSLQSFFGLIIPLIGFVILLKQARTFYFFQSATCGFRTISNVQTDSNCLEKSKEINRLIQL